MRKVGILGAGASGLVAIKECLDEGLEPVCFEKTGDIGGLWRYREEIEFEDLGCVFKSTVINTSKEIMAYSDFPIPKDFPNFMHNTKVLEYFRIYAKHHNLLNYIQFHTSVLSVTKVQDFANSGQWVVKLRNEKNGEEREEVFDAMLICSGHHAKKNIPAFPGQDEFQGDIVHTHEFKSGKGYEDKRVVIIGIGNSAGDAAVELSRVASQVYLSTRRGSWIIHRLTNGGYPIDFANMRRFFFWAPLWFQNMILKVMLHQRLNHRLYGLEPAHEPLAAHPTVNDDLPNRLANGRVILKPNIKCFTKTGVEFEDGTVVDDIDVVVLGTGYIFGFPFLPKDVVDVEKNQLSLFKYVFQPQLEKQTLAVIGFVQPWGAINPISEIQCRWAIQVFKGKTNLPSKSEMMEDIEKTRKAMVTRYVASQRHTIQVDFIDYMDMVADLFGVKPNLRKMIKEDPLLCLRLVFGPYSPYQYRLEGPGKWPEAKKAIETIWERVETPLQSRQSEGSSWLVFYVFIAILLTLLYFFIF